MVMRLLRTTVLFVLVEAVAGCDSSPAPLSPSPVPPVTSSPPVSLVMFTESASGFSTADLRDAQEQVLQINTAGELIWTVDGTRLPGYRVERHLFPGEGVLSFIGGNICPQGCAFEVRFGTRDGERRAYLTVDYGHENHGTVVDVEVTGGALIVTPTDLYVPGTFTLSGVVTEDTGSGPEPVEGASVRRGVATGWRVATTNRLGFYQLLGMYDGTDSVVVVKDGYRVERTEVPITGDTRFDVRIARQ